MSCRTCPIDGTFMNFFKITEWWLERDPTLKRDNLGKKFAFCGGKFQHQWIREIDK